VKNSRILHFCRRPGGRHDHSPGCAQPGLDPTTIVEIPLAVDLAERVEKLIGIPGIAVRIRELEKQGLSREEAALAIGIDFAEGRLGKGTSKIESVENAIRTSVALLTEGVVAAPIEGIARVDLGKNDDGTEYLKGLLCRSHKISRRHGPGPIRSRGRLCAKKRRHITLEAEAGRGWSAMWRRSAFTSAWPACSIRLLTTRFELSCAIALSAIEGEPTEEEEVSGYRDLARIETNRVRGGIALVSAEGIALEAAQAQEACHKTWHFRLGVARLYWPVVKKKVATQTPKFLRDLIAGGLYFLSSLPAGRLSAALWAGQKYGPGCRWNQSRQHAAPGRVHGCRAPRSRWSSQARRQQWLRSAPSRGRQCDC